MKSYLQGLISGSVLMFAFLVLVANQNPSIDEFINQLDESDRQIRKTSLEEMKVGKYQMIIDKHARPFLFDTKTGAYYSKSSIEGSSVDVNHPGLWNVKPIVPAHGFVVEN